MVFVLDVEREIQQQGNTEVTALLKYFY